MILKIALISFALALLAVTSLRIFTSIYASSRLFRVGDAPRKRVAVVFGAGLWRDGTPTPVLKDRVETAADLYFSGKVEKLLMSGDNRVTSYNEPKAMQAYALQLGVPAEAIVQDYAGRRTYDTCYRAREIFGVDDVILITQRFHLPRALFTCNLLGIKAVGVPADRRYYTRRSSIYWNMREIPATVSAFWELLFSHPVPVLGVPEPIFKNKG
ncbi:MAG: vancomycin high temperature exclusion protein [Omnitrophica WOR_2 bacterium]